MILTGTLPFPGSNDQKTKIIFELFDPLTKEMSQISRFLFQEIHIQVWMISVPILFYLSYNYLTGSSPSPIRRIFHRNINLTNLDRRLRIIEDAIGLSEPHK
jgi:hypothetical protein